MRRLLASCALLLAFGMAMADLGAIRLSSFPTMSVADGRSTATISAEIRQSNGQPVADGTRVVFNTTLGSFRENIVTTSNGYARAILVAGSSTGTAKITASALSGEAAPSTLEYEFVSDSKALSSAKEYIELVASGYMQYTPDNRLMGASGINGGVTVRYRELSITADDIQLNTSSYELRARKAKVKIGNEIKKFDELYLRLNTRRGYGTTSFQMPRPESFTFTSKGITGVVEQEGGTWKQAPLEDRYGLVEIRGSRLIPTPTRAPSSYFAFEDLGNAPSTILAKKAIVFPMRQIQFQQAEFIVAGRSVMKMPLYQANMMETSSPIVTESILGVNNSQVQINYPYFLTLKPGQTQLLRFTTGNTYGRGQTSNTGAFLNYEFNWNRGDDMDGGFTFQGIGRSDWGVSLRHYQRLDDRSTGYAQLDMPGGNSLLGSASISRQFDGFTMNLNGNTSRTLKGIPYNTQDASFIIEKDPTKVGKLPIKLFFGLTATDSYNSLISQRQNTAGVRMRAISNPIALDKKTNLTSSFAVSKLSGANTVNGMTYTGNVSLSRQLSRSMSLLASYDYTKDGFNDTVVGQHRVSLQSYYNQGRLNANVFFSKSLDVDRSNTFGDLSYSMSRLWRFGYQYTFDKLAGSEFLDYSYVIGYRLGWREVGLTWSRTTNRIGIQLLGAPIN